MKFPRTSQIIFVALLGTILGGLSSYNYASDKIEKSTWGEPVQVTKGLEVNQVHFTPDGKLLFTADGGILTANADGTNMRLLFRFKGVRRVALSPDGRRVIFDNDFDVFAANIDGSDLKPVANNPDIFEFASSFSPGGQKVAFVTIDDKNLTYGIWLMDPDGSNKSRILLTKESVLRHPRWSPDGNQISYFGVRKGKPVIWVMDRDGRGRIRLTSDFDIARQASWSHDGRRFVYSSRKAGSFDLWTMDVDGSRKARITDIAGDEAKPVWSPNNEKIAFVCSDCFNTTGSDLYVISRK